MNRKLESVPVIVPPALDVEESELAARNEFLAEKETSGANDFDDFGGADETTDEIILDENDAAPGSGAEEREAKNLRRAKRRKSLLFLVVFGGGFGIFVVFISWAFGFGFFAPPSRIAVDRNQKTNNSSSSPSATSGDEKLKTALALVANDNTQTTPVISMSYLCRSEIGICTPILPHQLWRKNSKFCGRGVPKSARQICRKP